VSCLIRLPWLIGWRSRVVGSWIIEALIVGCLIDIELALDLIVLESSLDIGFGASLIREEFFCWFNPPSRSILLIHALTRTFWRHKVFVIFHTTLYHIIINCWLGLSIITTWLVTLSSSSAYKRCLFTENFQFLMCRIVKHTTILSKLHDLFCCHIITCMSDRRFSSWSISYRLLIQLVLIEVECSRLRIHATCRVGLLFVFNNIHCIFCG